MEPEFRKPLIVGNWKMHGEIGGTIKLLTSLKNLLVDAPQVEAVVAPPFTSLYSASIALQDTLIKLAGQNLFWEEEEGAYTGEVSGRFLKDVGCQFVIVGHSERRQYFQESNQMINQKVQAALKSELTPIICIGESQKDRDSNQTFEVIEEQIKQALKEVAIHDFERLVIAYEPVWAIGTGKNATPEQAQEVHAWIRDWLKRYFDAPTANLIHVLYGGSVKVDNAPKFMQQSQIDGLLVGGASLDGEDFAKIIKFEERLS